MHATKAVNTNLAYAWAWRIFERWCRSVDLPALPASTDTLKLFVLAALKHPYALRTIELALSAVADRHRSAGQPTPIDRREVRTLLSNAARLKGGQQVSKAKAALTCVQLRRMCERLGERPVDVRDRAMLVFTFASGLRRSEIAGLDLRDIRFQEQGILVYLRKSKTDQKGEGREIGIPPGRRPVTCPVRALREWLKVRGAWQGPLFCSVKGYGVHRERIAGRVVATAVKKGIALIGEDTTSYAGHSLRAGMITTAVENGASELAIMRRTGHRSVAMVNRYVRKGQVFAGDPLRGVL